ncbi:MAG: cell division protein DivIVA [Desulfobacteraceae bacterium 4572_130]|nr:MAG: cell division protein DivIVA [Desulfobacteraceae bacterium 4572_130]
MSITSDIVQQKTFTVKFRGFDVQEVDSFLELISSDLKKSENFIQNIKNENHRLNLENQGYKERENSMKRIILHSQKIIEQMKKNAEKSAEIIIANAEVEAEKILNKSHQRLSQLHNDIIELKRQRIQIEMQISSVIEAHSKLIEMGKEENKAADETDLKLRFINQV